jgi:glucose/arabinose dehydrogenase
MPIRPLLLPVRVTAVLAAAVLGLLSVACSGDDRRSAAPTSVGEPATSTAAPSTAPPATAPPATGPPGSLGSVGVKLTRVASLSQPLDLAFRPGDDTLYVAQKGGKVVAVHGGGDDVTTVLDLTGGVSTGGEQGLLGLVFSADGSRLYVNYTDPAGDTRVVEYAFAADGRADPGTARELLFVDQPFANHNGGNLVSGPDGMLWIGLGDGGGGGDPKGNAQSLGTLLGKMLRIDPRPSGGRPYTVPADNPFVATDGARGEIWAFGLRNPWRYSFDKATGDLWIGDVGQDAREEVDFVAAGSPGGLNFGWPRLEGTRTYSGSAPPGAVAPILDYPLEGANCAVTAGYVYRGTKIPGLVGAFLYGDVCAGWMRAVRQEGGKLVDQADLPVKVDQLDSFGQDAAGELYALSLGGGVYRIDPA